MESFFYDQISFPIAIGMVLWLDSPGIAGQGEREERSLSFTANQLEQGLLMKKPLRHLG
jgi:hypothetical protein